MKIARPLLKNFFSLSLTELLIRLSNSLLSVYIARTLGSRNFGQLGFAGAFITFFTIFSDFGLTGLGIREIAKEKKNLPFYTTNILAIQLVLAVVLFLFLTFLLYFLPLDQQTRTVTFLFGFTLFPTALNLSYLFRALEKMEYLTLITFFSRLGYLLSGFILIAWLRDIRAIPLILTISKTITALASIILLKKYFRLRFQNLDWQWIKNLARRGRPFLISALAIQTYYNLNPILLQFLQNSTMVGFYNAAYKLIILLNIVPRFFQAALLPTLTRVLINQPPRAEKLLQKTSKLFFLLGLPLAVGGTLTANSIINLVYGSSYQPSRTVLQILIWSVFFVYANVNFGVLLLAGNKEKIYARISTHGALINLISALILIPHGGINGAALAVLLTEAYICFSYYLAARKIIPLSFFPQKVKILLATTIMALIILVFPLPFLLLLPLAAAAYFLSLLLLRAFTAEDRTILLNLWQQRKK